MGSGTYFWTEFKEMLIRNQVMIWDVSQEAAALVTLKVRRKKQISTLFLLNDRLKTLESMLTFKN